MGCMRPQTDTQTCYRLAVVCGCRPHTLVQMQRAIYTPCRIGAGPFHSWDPGEIKQRATMATLTASKAANGREVSCWEGCSRRPHAPCSSCNGWIAEPLRVVVC